MLRINVCVAVSILCAALLTDVAQAEPATGNVAAKAARDSKYVVFPEGSPADFEQELGASGARVLASYGKAHAVAVPAAAGDGFLRRMTALSADVRELEHGIHTPGRSIDPGVDVPPPPKAGVGLFLLQYTAPATTAWQNQVRQSGAVEIQAIPERTVLLVATPEQMATLARESWVEYLGPYLPEYKFAPANAGMGEFVVQMADTPATAPSIAQIEKSVGGFLTKTSYDGRLTARFRTDLSAAKQLLSSAIVLGVETYVNPQASDERQSLSLTGARTISGASTLAYNGQFPSDAGPYRAWLARYGLSASTLATSGIVVDIADTGVDMGCYFTTTDTRRHPDLLDRIAYNNGTTLPDGFTEAGAFTSPPYKDIKGHGTVVAGIVAANPPSDGTNRDSDDYGSFYYGMGVAPGIKLGNTVMMSGSVSTTQFGTVKDWTTRAVSRYCNTTSAPCSSSGTPCRATVQNFSNNEYTTTGESAGYYTINAQLFDVSVRRADHVNNIPLAITAAAGNIGQMSGDVTTKVLTPATAKNVISVGAVETFRQQTSETSPCLSDSTQGDNPYLRNQAGGWDVLAYGSRRGTADNRLKPDILAPATLAAGPFGFDGGKFCFQSGVHPGSTSSNVKPRYHGGSGTSFAAPVAAGAIALLRQFYGNVYPYTAPSPAMYKAMLVAGARSITSGYDRYTSSTITSWPNAQQGFGVIGLDSLFNSMVVRARRDQDVILSQSQTASYTLTVYDPSQPVKIVVAWTDKEGAVQDPTQAIAKSLVNDLDLKASWADGTRYYGNVISSTTGYSFVKGCGRPTCGYPADGSNNVEMLNIDPARFADPANRTFTVSVTASILNGIGVPGGSANNQDFALFVVNGTVQNQ